MKKKEFIVNIKNIQNIRNSSLHLFFKNTKKIKTVKKTYMNSGKSTNSFNYETILKLSTFLNSAPKLSLENVRKN